MSNPSSPIDPDAEQLLVDAGRVVHTRDRLDQALIEAMVYEGRGFPVLPLQRLTELLPEVQEAQAAFERAGGQG